ncbi:MAG: dihydropteroate synthase [Crocinitomicaceae bacterium]|nr:dihydropteroate synthase [Crocinitomicaceae bacterium]
MGIINTTPDSFYSKSRVQSEDELLENANKMLEQGAEILDIGGYSSRPGADDISESEEKDRVIHAVEILCKQFPNAYLSIDTFRASVADTALQAGAHIINDISGGHADTVMFETVAEYNAPYIMMHMKGTPQNMVSKASYENLIQELQLYFSEGIQKARAAGIKDIIIDPGFGFSKKISHNFKLMQQLEMLHIHDCPLLIGISRKSLIYKTLDTSPENSLNGTTVLNTIALIKGAQILRVHDVKEAKEAVELITTIRCAE